MKHKNSSFLYVFFPLIFFCVQGFGQPALTGRISEIKDGRTVVLEMEDRTLTVTVSLIDVPELEQPFGKTVKDHTSNLLLNNIVKFYPTGIQNNSVIGQIFLNGSDVALQLIRDGAAWHLPKEISGQTLEEGAEYVRLQNLAKDERRGIWSISNLTPAWEFRAAKERAKIKGISNQYTKISADGADFGKRNYDYGHLDEDMWVEVGGRPVFPSKNSNALNFGYDPVQKIRNISTASVAQVMSNNTDQIEIEIRLVYFEREPKPRTPNTAYVLGLLSTSKSHQFADVNTLRFVADGKEIVIADGQRFWRQNDSSVQEMFQYRVGRSDLLRIANAEDLTVSTGSFSGTAGNELKQTLLKLLMAARSN